MAKIAEIISAADLEALYPRVQEALDTVYEIRSNNPHISESGQFRFPSTRWDLAEPILRYYHGKMRTRANPDGHYQGYLKTLVAEELEGVATDRQMSQLASQIIRTLTNNNLIVKHAKDDYQALAWPTRTKALDLTFNGPKKPAYAMSRKAQAETEQRIAEEKDKPVTSVFDLKAIPPPKPNPESILDYVQKLKKSYDRLCSAYQQEQQANQELRTELEQAKEVLDKLDIAGMPWMELADAIRETVGTSD